MSWQAIKERLAHALGHHQSPNILAASWACGVAISLSPFLGLHTVLALALAFAFRLNKVDVLLGTLLINPWTLAPYSLVAVSLGKLITGKAMPFTTHLPHPTDLLDGSFWRAQEAAVAPLLLNWTVGASLCSLVGGTAVYLAVRFLAARRRRALPPAASPAEP
ncbi:hypothetical protein EG19_04550 [Thermoanaerobaculum aquaticum]|uniref:DUF2062 domain-containing protein n=1 Tax=Thermoanaerobaculum aquaticum TaxID=1312852 RepID=A0A062XRP3_9BACT|nr:DUF2062 domain-containing protein [Thermoanaerobaculum aquaticum]KDA53483.1 hypothetical protein EG19_04550 [Thermoanaerobaculum aquaticum]